jgi:hypothetical protein
LPLLLLLPMLLLLVVVLLLVLLLLLEFKGEGSLVAELVHALLLHRRDRGLFLFW